MILMATQRFQNLQTTQGGNPLLTPPLLKFSTLCPPPLQAMKTRAVRPPVQLGLNLPCVRRRRKRPGVEDFKQFVRLLRLTVFPFPVFRSTEN
jgi:hypothetical protein